MAGPIRIAILANGSQARREIGAVQGTLGRLGKFTKSGLGFGLLTAGVVGFGKSAVDAEKHFSTAMRMIQASTGAPAAEMGKLNDLAVKLGQDTSFSAGEAADAMLELAKAGLDTKTIMGGGLAGTLTLAAAGGTDLATASTIASNALNTFNLRGRDMASVAAALAGGANASTASVETLGQALQQVGPGATNAGLSLQETVAALAAFDSAGIKGSDAGTSLKTMLTRLVPSTKAAATAMENHNLKFTDAHGKFLSLTKIAEQLRRNLKGLSEEERTRALATIFGSDATRAATVLMNEGADGIRAYIKATKDQDAAQKAANARMSGTEGALEKLSGAIETAKLRLGQELAPAIIAGADALDDKLVPAIETAIDAGKQIGRALAPAVEEITEALGHLGGEGGTVASLFEDAFIPALEAAAEVVGALVDFIDDLPGPVKEVGAQALIAAYAFPRLAAGVGQATGAITLNIAKLQQLRAEMTYTATRAQLTSAAMSKLKGAAGAAAGIGGMVSLTQSTDEANASMKVLERTVGGALLGFSLGGPVGAAIGGLGGLVTVIGTLEDAWAGVLGIGDEWWTTQEEVREQAERTTKGIQNQVDAINRLRATMDGWKTSGETAKVALEDTVDQLDKLGFSSKDVDASLKALGVSQRTLAKAATGDAAALQQITDAYANAPLDKRIIDQNTLADAISHASVSTREAVKAERDRYLVAQDLSGLIGKLPKNVYTKIEATGVEPTVTGVAKVARQYKLTPKQIQSVIDVVGVDATVKQVQKVKNRLEDAGNADPKMERWKKKVTSGIDSTKGPALSALKGAVTDPLNQAPGKASPNLAPYATKLQNQINGLRGTANTSGKGVGSNIGAGLYTGLDGWTATIQAKAASLVRGAISAANAAGAIRSPSRKTKKTGEDLVAGLILGLGGGQNKANAAARRLMRSVLAGVDDGRSGVDASLAKVTAFVEKSVNFKDDKRERRREQAILKNLDSQYDRLRRIGKAQDANTRRLEKAKDSLSELTQQYKDYDAAIKASIVATGDVTQLGRQEDGTVSIRTALNELENKVNNAERFDSLIQQLSKPGGLNQTAIQQMLDAGPEAALATAEAIASGGAAAIKEINDLQSRLAATGTRLGGAMADKYYGAGVDAAKGIVKGLEAEAKRLDRAAVKLANELVKSVKKALGIRSPSRVFAGIGDNVIRGLDIGLDETYVRRSGAQLASSLEKGFGTPALDAYTRAQADGGPQMTARIRLSAEQASQLQRGREIIADVDFARSNGVRAKTF